MVLSCPALDEWLGAYRRASRTRNCEAASCGTTVCTDSNRDELKAILEDAGRLEIGSRNRLAGGCPPRGGPLPTSGAAGLLTVRRVVASPRVVWRLQVRTSASLLRLAWPLLPQQPAVAQAVLRRSEEIGLCSYVSAGVNPRLFAGEDAVFCECRS